MTRCCARPKSRIAGFTFVEVLVAIVFIAIVVPIAVQGILTANRAGVVAERKRIATGLADYKLTELVLTDDWRYGETEGDFGEEHPGYTWTLAEEAWAEDVMTVLTITVGYLAQGRLYEVSLSTLVPETEAISTDDAIEVQ